MTEIKDDTLNDVLKELHIYGRVTSSEHERLREIYKKLIVRAYQLGILEGTDKTRSAIIKKFTPNDTEKNSNNFTDEKKI